MTDDWSRDMFPQQTTEVFSEEGRDQQFIFTFNETF